MFFGGAAAMKFLRRFFGRLPINTNHHDVVLYTRGGCHLCDAAKAILLRHGLAPNEIDIDKCPDLLGQFGECVPVVEIDGKVRFRGRIDHRLLKRLLREN